MLTQDEILGNEFDWFATDRLGNIAVLSSAGTGLVPSTVLAHVAEQEALAEHFRPRSLLRSEWAQFAESGLYVYDCQPPLQGPYCRTAIPTVPAHLLELSASLRVAAQRFTFEWLEFQATETIPRSALSAPGGPAA